MYAYTITYTYVRTHMHTYTHTHTTRNYLLVLKQDGGHIKSVKGHIGQFHARQVENGWKEIHGRCQLGRRQRTCFKHRKVPEYHPCFVALDYRMLHTCSQTLVYT